MSNNDKSLNIVISGTINDYLDFIDGSKIRLIANNFNLEYDDKYDYGNILDLILYFTSESLENSIKVLQFINNDFK